MIDEVVVNRWIQRYLEGRFKVYTSGEIAVSEAASPCLRRSYYHRVRLAPPTPFEFLKVAGSDIHLALQSVLRGEGWEVEVPVSLRCDGFVLRGRVDALKEDTILEFKTVARLPEEPHGSHVLQTQAYMLMLKVSRGYVVYLSRSDGRVRVFAVRPDGRALKRVVERARRLHESLVSGSPPEPSRGPWCNGCGFGLSCHGRG